MVAGNGEGALVSLDAPPTMGIGFCDSICRVSEASMKSTVLSIPPSIYREYPDEYKELARSTSDELLGALYLKMATMWEHAALRFENGGLTSERDQAEGDQRP